MKQLKVYTLLALLIFLVACQPKKQVEINGGEKLRIEDAKGFQIEDFEGYKLLTVFNPWQDAKNVKFEYVLISDSSKINLEEFKGKTIIHKPINKVVCFSTTHIGMLSVLGQETKIVGTSGLNYISDPVVRKKIEEGKVKDIGYEQNVSYETLLNLQPDLVIAYGIGSEVSLSINKIKDLGIPVVLCAEYLENTPIARLEWIKYLAAFFDKNKEAEEYFSQTKKRYDELKNEATKFENQPKILTGLSWKGTWHVPGGDSFVANYIKDAGGKFIWDNNSKNESIPYSLESIFETATGADIWINISNVSTKEDIQKVDTRLKHLNAFKNNQLFNNNKQLNPHGGNNYWEQGIVEPDVILKDLIRIFHPLNNHREDLVYYQQLDE